MRPVPHGLSPDLTAFLTEMRSAISQLQVPRGPVPDFGLLQADLPPAAEHMNSQVLVTDKNTLAISTLVGTSWVWRRADGSAL